MYIIRRPPERISFSALDTIIVIMVICSASVSLANQVPQEIVFFQALGFLGLFISLSGIIFLNKSFGIFPADRGIITNGIYRFVRHPVYAGYFISSFSFLVQNYTLWNASAFTSYVLFQGIRVLREEELLKKNPEYMEYTKKTRWRILPYIW
jgi:protein-S-isoprenylcysteine O-methyltransferase Ste14